MSRGPNSDKPEQALSWLSGNSNLQAISLLIPALQAIGAGNGTSSVAIADKLIPDLKEAQELTHISRADLIPEGIKNRKLKAAKRGRGRKVKRDNLNSYVKSL